MTASLAKAQRAALGAGAAVSAAIAALHVAVVVAGPPGYRYFGAPALALAADRGAMWPALVTLALAVMFAVWALYALAGMGVVRPLPLLRTVLLLVGTVYVLRGILLAPELVGLLTGALRHQRALAFSAVSLLAGVCYLVGFRALRTPRRPWPRSTLP